MPLSVHAASEVIITQYRTGRGSSKLVHRLPEHLVSEE